MNSQVFENDDPDPLKINPTHWECFGTAIQFLTRIPVLGTMEKPVEYYHTALKKSVIYFPVVGGLVGLLTAIVLVSGVKVGLPFLVAALIALGIEAALTGAFHEDAFADTCDALGGGWTRAQVLEIMKDSRLGTYGTLALVIGVGCRAAAIASIVSNWGWWTPLPVMSAASLGRIAIVVMMATTSPIANRESQAKDVSGMQTHKQVWIASGLSAVFWLPWVVVNFPAALLSCLAAIAVFLWFRNVILTRVGGTSGDLLGCTAFLIQLIFTIGASAQ